MEGTGRCILSIPGVSLHWGSMLNVLVLYTNAGHIVEADKIIWN